MPSATRRAELIEAGVCTSCCVEPADDGRTRCAGCRDRAAEPSCARATRTNLATTTAVDGGGRAGVTDARPGASHRP